MFFLTARAAMKFVLAAAALIAVQPGTATAEIRFGVLPHQSAVEVHAMMSPLAAYLTREIGEKVSLVMPKDFEAFKKSVRSGQINLGFANSLVYVQLKKDLDLEPIALSSETKSGTRSRGVIIARKDSGITGLQDLKGRKLSFVDKDCAAGYLFPMLLLARAGLNAHQDFMILPFANKSENVAMAVFNRAADAGGIGEEDLERMKDKIDLSQIRIITSTRYIPNWPVFTVPNMSRTTRAKIKAALLKLKPNNPECRRILRAAGLSGFAPVADGDYDEVRRAARLAGML